MQEKIDKLDDFLKKIVDLNDEEGSGEQEQEITQIFNSKILKIKQKHVQLISSKERKYLRKRGYRELQEGEKQYELFDLMCEYYNQNKRERMEEKISLRKLRKKNMKAMNLKKIQ